MMMTSAIRRDTAVPAAQGWLRCKTWHRSMAHAPTCPAELVHQLWEDPASLVANGIALSHHNRVRTIVVNEIGGIKVVVKRYVERSWRHALKGSILRSRAEQAVRNTLAVAAAGVPVPAPLAFRNVIWGTLQQPISYFLYEYLQGETLASFLQSEPAVPGAIEHIAQQSGCYWERLAKRGLLLHDPSGSNFLVDGQGRLWVIDLDKLERHPMSSRFQRLANESLARFLTSQSRFHGQPRMAIA
ncbi:MAG: lipopolysaccharide kinase InaA family protein [Planctomycetaceae bacterium]